MKKFLLLALLIAITATSAFASSDDYGGDDTTPDTVPTGATSKAGPDEVGPKIKI